MIDEQTHKKFEQHFAITLYRSLFNYRGVGSIFALYIELIERLFSNILTLLGTTLTFNDVVTTTRFVHLRLFIQQHTIANKRDN